MHPQTPTADAVRASWPRPWGVPHRGRPVWARRQWAARASVYERARCWRIPLCSTHSTCWRPSAGLAGCGQRRASPVCPHGPGGLLSQDRASLREDCAAGRLDAAASSPSSVLAIHVQAGHPNPPLHRWGNQGGDVT